MGDPIQVFEPYTFKTHLLSGILILISIGIIGFLFYYNKKELSYEAKKRKGMYSMLLYTALLLTTVTAILNIWNSMRLKPVKLYVDAIELPHTKIPFEDIRKTYIYVHLPVTITTPPPDSVMNYDKSLFIEEFDKNKPMHILAEDDYPIEAIFDKMKEVRTMNN